MSNTSYLDNTILKIPKYNFNTKGSLAYKWLLTKKYLRLQMTTGLYKNKIVFEIRSTISRTYNEYYKFHV